MKRCTQKLKVFLSLPISALGIDLHNHILWVACSHISMTVLGNGVRVLVNPCDLLKRASLQYTVESGKIISGQTHHHHNCFLERTKYLSEIRWNHQAKRCILSPGACSQFLMKIKFLAPFTWNNSNIQHTKKALIAGSSIEWKWTKSSQNLRSTSNELWFQCTSVGV